MAEKYKYTILIPQQAYETLGIQIKLESAAVMSLLQELAGVTAYANKSFKEFGKTYYWFAHTDIIGNLPMIFETRMLPEELTDDAKAKAEANIIASYKKRLRRVMSELIEIGLLEAHPNNREKNLSYYCFTELSDALITSYKNVQGQETPRTKTYKVSDKPRTKTYKVEQPTSYKNVPLSIDNNLSINKGESINESAHTPENFETIQSEEEEKTKEVARRLSLENKLTEKEDMPPSPISTTVIRNSEQLEEVLSKLYRTDATRLNRIKDKFNIYKSNWTKSGMRAAISMFSDFYFAQPDALAIQDELKADNLFCKAVRWLSKEVKDYKDEQIATPQNKVAQNQDLGAYLNNINKLKRDEYNAKKQNQGVV